MCDEIAIISLLRKEAPHIHLSLENLKNPTIETVAELYRWCILQITQCKDGVLDDIQSSLADCLENPQFFENAIPTVQLTMCLDFILVELGLTDSITIRDVAFPVRQRTLNFLNALMKLYSLVRERSTAIEEAIETEVQSVEEKLKLKAKNESMKEQIHECVLTIAEKSCEMAKVREEHELLKAECQKTVVKANDLRDATTTKKLQLGMKTKENDEKMIRLNKLKQRNALLSSQIIPSPEKLVNELQALDAKKLANRRIIDEKNDYLMKLISTADHLPKTKRVVDYLLESASNLSIALKKPNEIALAKEEIIEKIAALTSLDNTLNQKVLEKHENINKREQKCSKLVSRNKSKLAAIAKEIANEKKTINNLEQSKNQMEVASLELDDRCKAILKKIKELTEEHAKEIIESRESREMIFKALESLNEKTAQYYAQFGIKMPAE